MKKLLWLLPFLLFLTPADAQVIQCRTTTAAQSSTFYANGSTGAVNCDRSGAIRITGSISASGGTEPNNADNVATSADNSKTVSWLYGWDGSAWDRLPGNSTTGLTVNGTVTANAGSGTFIVGDGAGALNVIVDSLPTVTVTDGAGALNVIVDSITAGANVIGKVGIDQTTPGTTNLVQITDGAGAVNTIIDSGTVTTVTTVTTVGAVTAITNALPAGNNNIGDVDIATIAAGNNNIGDVDVASIAAGTNIIGGTIPSSSATVGGTTLYTLTAAASTNATNVKNSAGQVYSLSGYTISATAAWLSLYNTSGTPTCGTSIIQQYLIPGSTTGAGFNISFPLGKTFATGIGICLTTGIAGTGSVAASSYVLNVDYK